MANSKQRPTLGFESRACRDAFIAKWNEANPEYKLYSASIANEVPGFWAYFGRDWYNSLVLKAVGEAAAFQSGYKAALERVAKWIEDRDKK